MSSQPWKVFGGKEVSSLEEMNRTSRNLDALILADNVLKFIESIKKKKPDGEFPREEHLKVDQYNKALKKVKNYILALYERD